MMRRRNFGLTRQQIRSTTGERTPMSARAVVRSNSIRIGSGLAILCASLLCVRIDVACHAEEESSGRSFAPSTAVLVSVTGTGELELKTLDPRESLPATTRAGLLLWRPETGRERWVVLTEGGEWPIDSDFETADIALQAIVRGGDVHALSGAASEGLLAATVQLEPLDATTLVRGTAFVTPQDGAAILSSRPTIRRAAESGRYPARTATISSANSDRVILRIPFRDGQQQSALSDELGWPASMKDGLPPGRYLLRFENGLELNRFTVVHDGRRQQVLAPIKSIAKLAGDSNDPMAAQFAIEHLLTLRTDDDQPAFLGDALDLVESLKLSPLPGPLQRHRASLRDWLDKLATDPGYVHGRIATKAFGTDTGIESIDTARQQIADGRWADALEQLNGINDSGDDDASRRLSGLKHLYLGVIFAEAGAGLVDKANQSFDRSIQAFTAVAESPRKQSDLVRIHNNVGNLRLLLAQNSLGNHAFQMASGVDQPMLNCLLNLIDARQSYLKAEQAAQQVRDHKSVGAIRVNQARVWALLADVIRTIDPDGPQSNQSRQFIAGEQAALAAAFRSASAALDAELEPLTRAAATELQAQLAYRKQDFHRAEELASQARIRFVDAGELSGVESVERLLGLSAMSRGDRMAAMKHFSIAYHLAELQRSRFPQDQTGQSRAGHFARHSFVYEKLVELHLAAGHPREALRFAELARARSAQDLLTTLGIDEQQEPVTPRDLDELLADWPMDLVAVEYFLGSEHGWGFVIRSGQVSAFPLLDRHGQLANTRQLIADVRQALAAVGGQRDRFRRQLRMARGFDHAWQDHLFDLRRSLLPDPVLAELRKVPHVLVVPQHILHYLPFAALVTERDATPRGTMGMAKPRYVLDEPFAMTMVPSLGTWDLIRRRSHGPLNQVRVVGMSAAPGAPLAGVERDLKNLRDLYGDNLKLILEGNEASETRIKQLLGESGLLMFATHGTNFPDQPADSFLTIMEDSSDATEIGDSSVDINDGRLTAREIFARRVNARLVVMSACYSGLGDRSPLPGDDLFGLQRAFLHAGARSVLSGLWDVYDGTAPDLMRRFHQHLIAGTSPSLALAMAQREFLNEQRSREGLSLWLHPYFWSVFCVAGAD